MARPLDLHEPATSVPKSSRLPSLDGWRALSILLVLGAHCKVTPGFPGSWDGLFRWLFDGALGVRFFFVISGFLITWLLLIERTRAGKVSLGNFYVRRALRILPVYYAFRLALAALQAFTKYHLSKEGWIVSLTFSTNFFANSWTSGHLWSLAQEEQFYFIWPGIFAVFSVAGRWRALSIALTAPIVLAPFFRVLAYFGGSPFFQIAVGLSRCDSIAFGCAAAIIFYRHRERIEGFMASHQ